jgi:hypothetical protein
MSDLIKIENIGYTANNNPSRAIRSGAEYEELLPAPDWREEIVKRNADVSQTVHEMQRLIKSSAWQTKALSKRLEAKDIYSTCNNIWTFLYSHCKYKEDDEGQEQLRTPALSWNLRTSRGIDCDDFSIFASTLLYNLGIPHYLRIARYSGKNYFQHVYVVVPQTTKKYITVDAVLDEYDSEKETEETKDFIIMNTTNLNGIDVTVLSGIEDDAFNELSGILSGVDFERTNELEGLGQIPSQDDELGAIYKHLVRTRDVIRRNPHYIKHVEDPETFLGMLDYAIGYWDTDKREEALGILEDRESELNYLHGLQGMPDGYESANVFYGIDGISGVVALGKVKVKRAFFKKVKEAAKKAGQGIKKIAKVLVRFNPATIAVRGGVLLAMKTNFLKIAEKIKWGYLTEDEARTNGFDVNEWKNAKEQLQKIENMFVKVLQGKPEALKKSIISGRAGGLNGITEFDGDLGVVVATATGASVATAMPFIKKILMLVKKINFKKLIAKVNPAKLMKGRKKAETGTENSDSETNSNEPETDNATALPESTSQNDAGTNEEQNSSPNSTNDGSPSNSKTTSEEKNTDENGGDETKNLPASQRNSAPSTTDKSTDENILTKTMNWVKDNKGMTALIAGGLIFALSSTARKAIGLGGTVRRGKKRKGQAKKNAPKTISGLKKNAKHKQKPKTPRKPRGGSTPTVKL